MLKLISLEIRKNRLGSQLKGIVICNLAILAFMMLVLFLDQSETDPSFTSYADALEGVFVFVKGTFIIYAAALLSRLVIDEYKNNTITQLFMYPIPRKKLMVAKLIIVFLFTLLTIIFSDVILVAILLGVNHFMDVIPGEFTTAMITSELARVGLGALYSAGIALIPLYVGMRKKSVAATIVSGVLVTSLISSGFDQFRLGNVAAVSIPLCLLGILIAYFSIHNIENVDAA